MGFVAPFTAEVQQSLIAIAEEQGLSLYVVRGVEGGFDVPDAVADAYADGLIAAATPAPEPKKQARKTAAPDPANEE